jgi:hypothetical protein
MADMCESLHLIADRILEAVEEEMLQLPPGWFQQHLGPFRTASQWHMKRYVESSSTSSSSPSHHPPLAASSAAVRATTATTGNGGGTAAVVECTPATHSTQLPSQTTKTMEMMGSSSIEEEEEEVQILLPMHTDPSLISVVIHDAPGGSNHDCGAGAMGLQYFDTKAKRWMEPDGHGHGVATILVGSVLSHLTGGVWPAARHRVVAAGRRPAGGRTAAEPVDQGSMFRGESCCGPSGIDDDGVLPCSTTGRPALRPPERRRMAATLFVRPRRTAMLRVPLPSPVLLLKMKNGADENGEVTARRAKPDMTFENWVQRVAKNYERKKRNVK